MTHIRRDYIAEGLLYAEDVVAGTQLAGELVRLACERQLRDLRRQHEDPEFPYTFDPAKAARVCRFIELLHHIKGKWARGGGRIRLEPWQIFLITTLFGWVHAETGLRRFSKAYIEVARKNAKSTLVAGLALYMLCADDEPGAEIVAAATKKEQARIVFDAARLMAERNEQLRNHYGLLTMKHSLQVPEDSRSFKAIDGKGSSQDGLNLHCTINDELHAWQGRALYEVLETARGSREQPLELNITTAGFNQEGVCFELRTDCARILQGRDEDESIFALIYTLDEGDDWTAEENWVKANPNLGVSVSLDNMRTEARAAIRQASKVNGFKTKRLNIWCNAATAWMDMLRWDAAKVEGMTLADFKGRECIAALDLATRVDIASRVLVFTSDDDSVDILARHYVPEAAVEMDQHSSYAGWVADGWLTATPGEVIDQARIQADLIEDLKTVRAEEIVFDRYQAAKMMAELGDAGFEIVDLTNSVANMSEPMKELEALVLQGKLRHNGDPVLRWMISNVVCRRDEKDNIFPRKEHKDSKRKIDGAVAAIMALNRVLARRETEVSVPEDYEVLVL
jgi:phage terminase large subunit-like protein